MFSPGCKEVRSNSGVVQLVHSWSVTCNNQWRIRVLHHVVLLFDKLLRISPANVMAKAFDPQSFVPGSRTSSSAVDVHCWWIPNKDETADTSWRIIRRREIKTPTTNYYHEVSSIFDFQMTYGLMSLSGWYALGEKNDKSRATGLDPFPGKTTVPVSGWLGDLNMRIDTCLGVRPIKSLLERRPIQLNDNITMIWHITPIANHIGTRCR